MKKIQKKILLILILLLVLILIITVSIIVLLNKNNYEKKYSYPEDSQGINEEAPKIEMVDDAVKFYTVENIVAKYFNLFLSGSYEEIYSILSLDYLEEFGIINDKTILELQPKGLSNYKNVPFITIDIDKIYSIQNTETTTLYFVSGYIEQSIEFNIMVETDNMNNTFCIFPEEYINKHELNKLEIGKNIKLKTKEMKSNDYNIFENVYVTDEQMIRDYLSKYLNHARNDIQKAYEDLDKEYREKRFGNIENYKIYLKENELLLKNSILSKYQVNERNDYTQYICIDQYGNYYIFKVTAIMQYSLILDIYTLDLPEFLEKYNSANEQEKCTLNINKIMLALNNGDYKYTYSKLDNNFKKNKFPSLQSFEQYMKKNLYKKLEASYGSFEKISGERIYTYKVTFTNANTENSKKIEKTFIIKLEEGTDFVYSFNV